MWKPIATAPKEGNLLIYSSLHGIAHVSWCRCAGAYDMETKSYAGAWDACFNNSDGYGDVSFGDATHWMPLPEPPNN